MLTGPPGAGKTATAELLAAQLPRSVCLETDWFWQVLRVGRVDPWLPEADEQNRVAIDAASAAMGRYAAGGYAVVGEGIVGPWFLARVAAALADHELPLHYAVLRPPREACVERVRRRSDGGSGIPSGPVRHMWGEFSDLGPYERHVLDNQHLSPAETASAVLGLVSEGALLLPAAGP